MNISTLISRIREEQNRIAIATVQFPSIDPHTNSVNAGKWQGLGITLKLIDEILTEDDELNK